MRPLGFNFFDPDQIEAVKGIISAALANAGSGTSAPSFRRTSLAWLYR